MAEETGMCPECWKLPEEFARVTRSLLAALANSHEFADLMLKHRCQKQSSPYFVEQQLGDCHLRVGFASHAELLDYLKDLEEKNVNAGVKKKTTALTPLGMSHE